MTTTKTKKVSKPMTLRAAVSRVQGDIKAGKVKVRSTPLPKGVRRRNVQVPVAEIVTDGYQREIDLNNLLNIVENFDPRKTGGVVLSERGGKYFVLDGQHRIAQHMVMGIPKIDAIVWSGLSVEDEAGTFSGLNDGKLLSPVAKFRADVIAGDEGAIEVQEVLDSLGLSAGPGNGDTQVAAISALRKIHSRYGLETLDLTLTVARNAWAGSIGSKAYGDKVLQGLSTYLYGMASDLNDYTVEEIVGFLFKVNPVSLYEQMIRTKETGRNGSNDKYGFAERLAKAVNRCSPPKGRKRIHYQVSSDYISSQVVRRQRIEGRI